MSQYVLLTRTKCKDWKFTGVESRLDQRNNIYVNMPRAVVVIALVCCIAIAANARLIDSSDLVIHEQHVDIGDMVIVSIADEMTRYNCPEGCIYQRSRNRCMPMFGPRNWLTRNNCGWRDWTDSSDASDITNALWFILWYNICMIDCIDYTQYDNFFLHIEYKMLSLSINIDF